MTKTRTITAVNQLSLNDLLDEKPGEFVQVPLRAEDVGAELVAILSKGLYTNPLDCIREYVQNSVDANATKATIKITGNSVFISDDGDGMDIDNLLQARQFAVSTKSLRENVGFRGIRLYSGFDLCNRLRIASKKLGDDRVNVLVFNFAEMRAVLDRSRHDHGGQAKVSLMQLLSEHTSFKREVTAFPILERFTQVQLEELSDVHIGQLSDRTEMRRYLLQNLPINFSEDFEYKEEINHQLSMHVPGYHPITIVLQSDNENDEVIQKPAIPRLQNPTFRTILTAKNHPVAFYWACMNEDRWHVDKNLKDGNGTGGHPVVEGFVYKVKGFTIGDRHRLRRAFSRKPQLYPWYTGEIYVIDENVVPNAERDDFETS
jgi:Histidine kinase-, DNA gyrase B-, and HSP90-like ATPase